MTHITLLRTNLKLLLVALFLSAAPAHAHRLATDKSIEIGIHEGKIVLWIRYKVAAGDDTMMARALFDRDSDGSLGAAEQKQMIDHLAKSMMRHFKLTIDDQMVGLVRTSASADQPTRGRQSDRDISVQMLFEGSMPKVKNGFSLSVHDQATQPGKSIPAIVGFARRWKIMWSNQGELTPSSRQIRRIAVSAGHPLKMRFQKRSKKLF